MLYKYFSDDAIQYFDDSEYFTLKFTKLEDYNDPYEQSLAVDLADVDSDNEDILRVMILKYQNEINECKGYLATCFSNRPDITPMWAHYGNEQRGFVIGINEDELIDSLTERGLENSDFCIENIQYKSGSDSEFKDYFEHYMLGGKGVHLAIAHAHFFKAFYFFKQSCWEYEKERRLIIKDNHKILFCNGSNTFLKLPKSCIDYIICGSKTNDIVKEGLQVVFNKPMYEFKISRSNIDSYFLDKRNGAHIYDLDKLDLVEVDHICCECSAPIEDSDMNKGMCFWCYAKNMD